MTDTHATKKRQYVTTIFIASDVDPKDWTLENFRWAIENYDADELSRTTVTTESFVKLGADLKTLQEVLEKL